MAGIGEAVNALVGLILGVGIFIVIIRLSNLIERFAALIDSEIKRKENP